MTTTTTISEIETILRSAGAFFDGGNDGDRRGLAEEWDAICTPAQVQRWIAAECCEPSTAKRLAAAGFRPGVDTLSYQPDHERDDMDAMYALCNSDVSIDGVTW